LPIPTDAPLQRFAIDARRRRRHCCAPREISTLTFSPPVRDIFARDVATAWVRVANFRRGLPLRMQDPRSLEALPRRGVPIGLAVRVASRVDRHARAVERE
jgi:hypothetical protein